MHSGPKYPRGLTLVAFGFDSVIELASAGVLIWRVAVENKRGEKCSGFRALLYEHSLGTLATSKRRFFTSGIVATNGVRRTIVDRGAHSPRIEIDHVYGTYEDDRTFSLARFSDNSYWTSTAAEKIDRDHNASSEPINFFSKSITRDPLRVSYPPSPFSTQDAPSRTI